MQYKIIKIQEHSEIKEAAANWFHSKWGVPKEAYHESMEECILGKGAVPQWYVVVDENDFIGGLGVIENDFHDRKDLAPNVCAVYVEDEYRGRGIAGEMLGFVCEDMKQRGIDTLYLVTDHTTFYERYDWEFLCMVQGDDEPEMTRMYIHKA
ncbi:MAG: GNAT family N-acetyltransferase [Lachnospiraceae bacterium]|nr:GNAT family N-acetyltransferase [Lachnospiraceae bacterium]